MPRRAAPLFVALAALAAGCSDAYRVDFDAAPPATDAGTSLGPTGGAVDLLHFGVFGDARPGTAERTGDYPTAIVGRIMDGLAAHGAQFVLATGDYTWAITNDGVRAQMDLLASAESHFPGFVYHAAGNHECWALDGVNCTREDESPQFRAFMARLVPWSPHSYYSFVVRTRLGDAHFVVTSDNAWTDGQAAWLAGELARPARYLVVVTHAPESPGVPGPGTASIVAMARAAHPTLVLYGHVHSYLHPRENEVVVGNGGAPLRDPSSFYGYLTVDQQPDGALALTEFQLGPTTEGDVPFERWTLR